MVKFVTYTCIVKYNILIYAYKYRPSCYTMFDVCYNIKALNLTSM